jgi:hypothetical protein
LLNDDIPDGLSIDLLFRSGVEIGHQVIEPLLGADSFAPELQLHGRPKAEKETGDLGLGKTIQHFDRCQQCTA